MRILTFAPLLLLAACMGAETEPAPTITEPVATEPQVPADAVPVPPRLLPEPDLLTGKTPRQVQSLMGEPDLVRRDDHVQVMLYESTACVFEVIFYEPNPDEHFHAEHMNARTRRGVDMDLQRCLVHILPDSQWLIDPASIQ